MDTEIRGRFVRICVRYLCKDLISFYFLSGCPTLLRLDESSFDRIMMRLQYKYDEVTHVKFGSGTAGPIFINYEISNAVSPLLIREYSQAVLS